jgi:hypothetical protein
MKRSKLPARLDVIEMLLKAKTPARVRAICEGAFTIQRLPVFDLLSMKETGEYFESKVIDWPICDSKLPRCLSEFADQFIAAKENPRFPRSGRKTTRPKQLWFLSRALAGAVFGLAPATATTLVPGARPEELRQARARQRQKRARS